MNKDVALGIDIGGSHISAVAVNISEGHVILESFTNRKVDNKASSTEILHCWKDALNAALSYIDLSNLVGIGFAMPGPFDYENGIAHFTKDVAKYENLNGVNVGLELRSLLKLSGVMPFRFINDATSFAIGEAWIGRSANSRRSISLTLGTGFGSAFIEDGIPVLEGENIPQYGCLWHLPFKNGIADDYFSTRWFVKRYEDLSGELLPGVKEIAEEAKNNKQADEIFKEFGTNLGEFLTPWLQKFDAQSLVLGGNLIKAWDLFGEPFVQKVRNSGVSVSIRLSQLGETAAMVGCSRLFEDTYWSKVRPLLSKM